MPVQINELVVKVTVNQDQNAAAQSASGNSGDIKGVEIVREAVEEALRIFENIKER